MNDENLEQLNSLKTFKRFNAYKRHEYHIEVWEKFWKHTIKTNKEDNILDFGCGAGWSKYIGRNYHDNIDLLDIDTKEVKDVFSQFHKILKIDSVFYWDGNEMPLKDNEYDIIISKASMSKLVSSNWENVISELVRLSKNKASWYIAPPYMLERLITNPFSEKTNSKIKNKEIELLTWDWGWRDPRNYD